MCEGEGCYVCEGRGVVGKLCKCITKGPKDI